MWRLRIWQHPTIGGVFWLVRAIPRLSLKRMEEAPHLSGAPSSGHGAPRGILYAFTNRRMPSSGRPGRALGVCAGARSGSHKQRPRPFPISGPTLSLWITCGCQRRLEFLDVMWNSRQLCQCPLIFPTIPGGYCPILPSAK